VGEPSEIRVNLPFRGRRLAEFLAIKDYLGIQTNADVVRYLVRRSARALRRRSGRRRVEGGQAGVQRQEARAGAGENAAPPQAGGEPDLICLDCPLPECDERDPRCLYRRALEGRKR
jgi:hypothetical protein